MSEPAPSRDGWDLVQEINLIERRLDGLDAETQDAHHLYRDAKIKLAEAQAAVNACESEYNIKRTRLMALQSELKAIPK